MIKNYSKRLKRTFSNNSAIILINHLTQKNKRVVFEILFFQKQIYFPQKKMLEVRIIKTSK